MNSSLPNVLLVGANGGASTAWLNMLVRHPRGRRLRQRLGKLVLVDQEPPAAAVELPPNTEVLPPRKVDAAELARLLRRHQIRKVIDLADVETVECVEAAALQGADFLCTGYSKTSLWPELRGRLGRPWPEVPPPRLEPELLERGSFLMGSGMNPGSVNALVFAARDRLATLAGVAVEELEIAAILFTEMDTTRDPQDAGGSPGIFPCTWHSGHLLDEVIRSQTTFMAGGHLREVPHSPHLARYRARCGRDHIEGLLISHEEVVTVGVRFPEAEVAFLYRLPEAALHALETFPHRGSKQWPVRKLYPPTTDRLEGFDRVGVLLSTHRHGELWLGFENHAPQGLALGTNPTLMQVAAGVVAGMEQLGEHRGLHFVEELDHHRFLEAVTEILGPPLVHHDPDASPVPLLERRVVAAETTSP